MMLVAFVLACAFLLDYVLGDPVYRLHPVRCIGSLIRGVERLMMYLKMDGIFGGMLLLVLVTVIAVAAYFVAHLGLLRLHWSAAIAFDIFVVYSCLALKDMVRHALPVAAALENGDIQRARQLVQRIVGRDVARLDAAGIARAAIESVSESFIDGFLSPVFWFIVAGAFGMQFGNPLPYAVAGIIIYRCVNTLDSMVGYRNEKYEKFGKFSARADDVMNFIPARLSLVLLAVSAPLCGMDARKGWRTAMRDRLKHSSPNSAHAESFMAGLLELRLGGPTIYSDGAVEKPWIGTGSEVAGSLHIAAACRVVMATGGLLTIMVLILGFFF